MLRNFTIAGVVVSLFFASGCGKTKSHGNGDGDKNDKGGVDHSSPQKVTESFKAAAKAKDWKSMFACVSEDGQKRLTMQLLLVVGFRTVGDEKLKKSLEDVIKKHAIDPDAKPMPGGDPTRNIKDKAALFGELIMWLEANQPRPKGGEKPKPTMLQQLSTLKLENVEIDGDKATADVVLNGKKKKRPVKFEMDDGKWYIVTF